MLYLLKTIILVLKEAYFDNKEEYNFRSPHFNSRKVMLFITMILSIILNCFLIERFLTTANKLIKAEEQLQEKCVPKPPEVLIKTPSRQASSS